MRDLLHRRAEELGGQLGGREEGDVLDLLTRHGCEPRREDETILLANCPFHVLAREHTRTVCGMNLRLLRGVLHGLGETELEACLAPHAGRCCVRLRPVA